MGNSASSYDGSERYINNKLKRGRKGKGGTSSGSSKGSQDSIPTTIKTKDSHPKEKMTDAKKVLKKWTPPEGEGKSGEAVRLAKAWVKAKNERDMDKLLELADPSACYRLPAENICIPMRDFLQAIFTLGEAFPDLEYEFADAAEPYSGVAVLYDYYATGTHTGKAYSFMGKTEVPPTGVHVVDGPIVKTFTIKNGKIIDFLVYAPLGNTVGPLAFYRATKDKHREGQALTPRNK